MARDDISNEHPEVVYDDDTACRRRRIDRRAATVDDGIIRNGNIAAVVAEGSYAIAPGGNGRAGGGRHANAAGSEALRHDTDTRTVSSQCSDDSSECVHRNVTNAVVVGPDTVARIRNNIAEVVDDDFAVDAVVREIAGRRI